MENITEYLNFTLKDKIQFSWYDYCLFTFMLGTSVLIGIYFGCFGKKQNTANEYLLGGKTMKVFPIAMSLLASDVSGITILAIPADVYKFGSSYVFSNVGLVVIYFIAAFITMPVFHNLDITSTYEYLELRFNTKTRKMASILFNLSMLLYLPIVIYGPALAFSQATSVNLHMINPIMCAICIFYTTIGGLKAVVWTDALQFSAMLGAIVVVLILGSSAVGGLETVHNRSLSGGRLDIDFDIDPTKGDTFWAVLIGWTTGALPILALSQGSVQKCLALPSMSHVKSALAIFCIGAIFCKVASVLTGLIIYAKYHDCDPFTSKLIEKNDQLLPYFIMDTASKVPGLPGLFIAGVFCASFSTLSAQMNALSATIYEDFISEFVSKDISQKRVSNILKCLVVIIGIVCTSLVFVVERLGGLLPLAISFIGVTSGPLLGLFILGMIVPFANSKGALAGSITSLIVTLWMMIGSQVYQGTGAMTYTPKPASIEGCVVNLTTVMVNETIPSLVTEVNVFYRITFYYYALVGVLIVLIVGLPVSWITGSEPKVDEKLITPCMRWAILKSSNEKKIIYDRCYEYELTSLNDKNYKIQIEH